MTFIVIEGVDASGKNTQSEKLAQFYRDCGRLVTKFDLPKYDTVTGEMIRGHLMGDWSVSLSSEAKVRLYDRMPAYMRDPNAHLFQCCQLVNRMESLPDGLWDVDDERVYIADRYVASAYAYGAAHGLDLAWLKKIHRNLPKADFNILLDISIDESFKRRPERRDAYEKNSQMLHDVRQLYLRLFTELGPTYHVVDATGSIDQTFSRILDIVNA